MSEDRPTYDNEIQLSDIFKTLWSGKWKIVGVVIISGLCAFGYQIVQPPNFVASTKIKAISSVEADDYGRLNAYGFFEVTQKKLLELYLEQLERRKLFETAIRNNQLIDPEEYKDEESYNNAVIALAYSIEIYPSDNVTMEDVNYHWILRAEYNDSVKWKKVLSSVDSLANQAVMKILKQQFQTALSLAEMKRDHELEDVQTKIANAISDYDMKTSDRVAYLREQAAIARTLGNKKHSEILPQTLNNIDKKTQLYKRGYLAIEKEIELITSRVAKEAFIEDLRELENKKRELLQDNTLVRANEVFNKTPISSAEDFSAASVEVESTEFRTSNRLFRIAFAVAIGVIVGAMYVLILDANRKRKDKIGKA